MYVSRSDTFGLWTGALYQQTKTRTSHCWEPSVGETGASCRVFSATWYIMTADTNRPTIVGPWQPIYSANVRVVRVSDILLFHQLFMYRYSSWNASYWSDVMSRFFLSCYKQHLYSHTDITQFSPSLGIKQKNPLLDSSKTFHRITPFDNHILPAFIYHIILAFSYEGDIFVKHICPEVCTFHLPVKQLTTWHPKRTTSEKHWCT